MSVAVLQQIAESWRSTMKKKAIRNGALQECSKCKTKLSRYNSADICVLCEKNSALSDKSKIIRMINDIS